MSIRRLTLRKRNSFKEKDKLVATKSFKPENPLINTDMSQEFDLTDLLQKENKKAKDVDCVSLIYQSDFDPTLFTDKELVDILNKLGIDSKESVNVDQNLNSSIKKDNKDTQVGSTSQVLCSQDCYSDNVYKNILENDIKQNENTSLNKVSESSITKERNEVIENDYMTMKPSTRFNKKPTLFELEFQSQQNTGCTEHLNPNPVYDESEYVEMNQI